MKQENDMSNEFSGKFNFVGQEKSRLLQRYDLLKKREIFACEELEKVLLRKKNQETRRKTFNQLRNYLFQRRATRNKSKKSLDAFKKRLLEKVFVAWKVQNRESIIETRFLKKMELDINTLKEEYEGILTSLRDKIKEVEGIIIEKRVEKNQLSANLARELMKTVSNLSLEIASLNQIHLRDKDVKERNYLTEINEAVAQKIKGNLPPPFKSSSFKLG